MQGTAQPEREAHDALPQFWRSWLGEGIVTIAWSTRIEDPVALPANAGAPAATMTRQLMNIKSEHSRFMGPMMRRAG